jgi:hypothetical protein
MMTLQEIFFFDKNFEFSVIPLITIIDPVLRETKKWKICAVALAIDLNILTK